VIGGPARLVPRARRDHRVRPALLAPRLDPRNHRGVDRRPLGQRKGPPPAVVVGGGPCASNERKEIPDAPPTIPDPRPRSEPCGADNPSSTAPTSTLVKAVPPKRRRRQALEHPSTFLRVTPQVQGSHIEYGGASTNRSPCGEPHPPSQGTTNRTRPPAQQHQARDHLAYQLNEEAPRSRLTYQKRQAALHRAPALNRRIKRPDQWNLEQGFAPAPDTVTNPAGGPCWLSKRQGKRARSNRVPRRVNGCEH